MHKKEFSHDNFSFKSYIKLNRLFENNFETGQVFSFYISFKDYQEVNYLIHSSFNINQFSQFKDNKENLNFQKDSKFIKNIKNQTIKKIIIIRITRSQRKTQKI